jgi:hypothetical protein
MFQPPVTGNLRAWKREEADEGATEEGMCRLHEDDDD